MGLPCPTTGMMGVHLMQWTAARLQTASEAEAGVVLLAVAPKEAAAADCSGEDPGGRLEALASRETHQGWRLSPLAQVVQIHARNARSRSSRRAWGGEEQVVRMHNEEIYALIGYTTVRSAWCRRPRLLSGVFGRKRSSTTGHFDASRRGQG